MDDEQQESSSQLASSSSSELSSSEEVVITRGTPIMIGGPIEYNAADADADEEDEEEESSSLSSDDVEFMASSEERESRRDLKALRLGAQVSSDEDDEDEAKIYADYISTPRYTLPRHIRDEFDGSEPSRRISIESPTKRRRTSTTDAVDPLASIMLKLEEENQALREQLENMRALVTESQDVDHKRYPKAFSEDSTRVVEWKIRKANQWAAGPDVKLFSNPFYVGNTLTKLSLKHKASTDSAWLYITFGDLRVDSRLAFSISVLKEKGFEKVSGCEVVVTARPLDWTSGMGAKVMSLEELKLFKHLTVRVSIYEVVPRLSTYRLDDQ